ncbi:hypothetical protein CRENBAI_016244 [Crenichthys baileyi]|uniref:Uncharacterized protein n=1 Tax=Crenichthys baileyi TaxID=28760 RepID=A0AAV9S4M1_9TELE
MTAFLDLPSFEQEETSKQIKELQRAVSEATQKLEEVRQERLRAEEEIARCKRETELRMELVMENSEIVDALHQLGSLLEEEKHRLEQLDEQAASHRNQRSFLEEQSKSASRKIQSLTAEIQEVKERLAELKACDGAAQASSSVPISKAKRKPRK